PFPLAGSDRGDDGIFPLPSGALVYRPEGSPWTFGLGAFIVGGFGVNYPASTFNPILTPPPPAGVGVGSIYTSLEILQLAPAVALRVTDRLAIGFGPTLDLADLRADPAFLASPDDANGDGFPTFPRATHGKFTWGGGFQAGAYYALDGGWQLGASVKSPQWFERFRFQGTDERGRARPVGLGFDFPLIASAGVAYAG